MTGILLPSTQSTQNSSDHSDYSPNHAPNEVFFCPEESYFYSQCLEKMVFSRCSSADRVVEFGSGDGSPVIHSLLRTPFQGIIHGYELNSTACQVAQNRIQQYQLGQQYLVRHQCFFTGWRQHAATYIIANPPYLPAPDNDLYLPALHGGADGSGITCKLLSLGCDHVLSLISAYSNPVDTIEYALDHGYQVADFMISPLKFGYYSSEPKVKNTIKALRSARKAFYSDNIYLLAGVLFQRHHTIRNSTSSTDLSKELLQVITAF